MARRDPNARPSLDPLLEARDAVIHVCESLASGILQVVPPLANATAALGFPTVVIYGRRSETPLDLGDIFDRRVRLVRVHGWGDRSFAASLRGIVRAASLLRRELGRFDGGVLHAHSTYAGIVGRTAPAARWRRFYTPQGYAFLNPSYPRPVRWLTRFAEVILANRAQTLACSKTEAAEAHSLGCRRVTVVQNGIEAAPRLPSASRSDGRLVVASVGRATHQRRPDLFAEMTILLRGRVEADFRWFGDGPDRALLSRAGVLVSGWLPQPELAAAIATVGVLVHLSAFEGLPLALLEGMSAGRAVVASDLPVLREVLGDAGIFVRAASDAAEAVALLSTDTALRSELATRARERADRLFTKEAMVERTLATYDLERGSPSRPAGEPTVTRPS